VNTEVDMVVGATPLNNRMIRMEHLFVPRYVCVMRLDHPLTQGSLTGEVRRR